MAICQKLAITSARASAVTSEAAKIRTEKRENFWSLWRGFIVQKNKRNTLPCHSARGYDARSVFRTSPKGACPKSAKAKEVAAKPRARLSRVRRLQRTPARPGRWRCSHGTLTRSLPLVSRCALPSAVFPARSHAPVLLPCSPHRAKRARSISRKLHSEMRESSHFMRRPRGGLVRLPDHKTQDCSGSGHVRFFDHAIPPVPFPPSLAGRSSRGPDFRIFPVHSGTGG